LTSGWAKFRRTSERSVIKPEGGRIEVAATPKDGFVEVSVRDTGVGIAQMTRRRTRRSKARD